jgi:hypothetical protein
MAATDARIDAYIARSADFAKPILELWRAMVHAAEPAIEETIKWGMPFFTLDNKRNKRSWKSLCRVNYLRPFCGKRFNYPAPLPGAGCYVIHPLQRLVRRILHPFQLALSSARGALNALL